MSNKYYIIQNTKNNHKISKHITLKTAMLKVQSMSANANLEILATEIHDCHSCELRAYNNEELYKIIDQAGNYIELDDGRWIKDCGDGRYYLNGNDNVKFAEVSVNRYNINGDFMDGEPIGFVKM